MFFGLLSSKSISIVKYLWYFLCKNQKGCHLYQNLLVQCSMVISIFLYACESWTLDSYLEKRVSSFEMRCLRKLLNIDYKQRISNERVRAMVTSQIGRHQDLLEIVKTRKMKWFGHVTRGNGLAKMCLQGTVRGGRARGRPKKKWSDNITSWTGLSFAEASRAAGCREGWRGLVRSSAASSGPNSASRR